MKCYREECARDAVAVITVRPHGFRGLASEAAACVECLPELARIGAEAFATMNRLIDDAEAPGALLDMRARVEEWRA